MALFPMSNVDPELVQQLMLSQQLAARNRPPMSEKGAAFASMGDAITGALVAWAGHDARQQQAAQLKDLIGAMSKNLPPSQAAIAEALGGNPQTAPLALEALTKSAFAEPAGMTPYQRAQIKLQKQKLRQGSGPSQMARQAADAGFDIATPEGRRGFAEWKRSMASGTNITLKNEGQIPPGYRAVRDASGSIERLEPIAGAPAAREIAEGEAQAAARQATKERAADIVTEDIDRALGMIERPDWELPRTGAAGQALSGVGGTAAHDLSQLLQSVRANIGFDRLQQMRESSPTGGALGNVTEQEIARLEAVMGSVVQSQSDEQLQKNLRRLRRVYNETVHGKPGGAPAPETKQQLTPAQLQSMSLDEIADYYGR